MYSTHVDLGVQRRKNGGMDWTAIGRRARRLRQDKGWTQAQLGKKAGNVSANTIRGFEKGTLNTRWPKIKEIVHALGTTIEVLAANDDAVTATDPRLVGLTSEDLTVARAYHDSQTALRQKVMTLLREGDEQEATGVPVAAHELWDRLQRLSPEERTTTLELVKRFEQTQEERHERRPVGTPKAGIPKTSRRK